MLITKKNMRKSYQLNAHISFHMLQYMLKLIFFQQFVSSTKSDRFLACLQNSNIEKTQVTNITYTPTNINYIPALQYYIRNARFNTSVMRNPDVILAPNEESQVQDIIKCAKTTGLELRIRSGGHDYEGISYRSNNTFIVLDMSNLRSIDINIRDETAWVQVGATLGELYYKISQNSKTHAFPAGVCLTVGVGGHFSGGGYGNLMRKYGLAADNVINAKIVDAKGQILDRKAMGEDVFWAICGGGGASFGVILSYKIKLVQVPPTVTLFKVIRTLEQNATELLYRWQYIAPELDNNIFVRAQLESLVGQGKIKGTSKVSLIGMFLGSAENLVKTLKIKFQELGLEKKDCNEMSWIKSVILYYLPDGTPESSLLKRSEGPPAFLKMKSDYVKVQVPKDGLQGLLDRIAKSRNFFMVQFNPYGGRMREIPESAIPYPHRAGNIFSIQYLILWHEEGYEFERKNINEITKVHEYMTPFVSKNPREAYLNYRDMDIGRTYHGLNSYNEGVVYGKKYFMGNFDKLVRVKTEFDPDNFFRNEQSIPVLKKTSREGNNIIFSR